MRHDISGLPAGFSFGVLSERVHMSELWKRQLSRNESALLDYLSAEARSAGVCPNHLYLLREAMARVAVGKR